MVDINPLNLASVAKTLASLIRIKHDAHDARVYINDALRYINENNFDIAVGHIDAAIERRASDKEDLSSLYLIKSAALLGQIAELRGPIILTNEKSACLGTTPELLDKPMGRVSQLGEEALEAINKSIAIDPRNSLAYYFKGFVFFSLSNLGDALKSFDNSLKLGLAERLRYFAYDMQGRLCLSLNRYDDAFVCYEHILQNDPTNTYALKMCDVVKQGLPVVISFLDQT